mmetsp:Transcript_5561/g.18460  ORF Transcript_5561/g.18460 Transcript_5561/m.18460 type:complete len:151 (+) Transcript_5561:1022-1474(+)
MCTSTCDQAAPAAQVASLFHFFLFCLCRRGCIPHTTRAPARLPMPPALPPEVLSLIVGRDPSHSRLCKSVRAVWEVEERARLARTHPDLPADQAAATPEHQLSTFLRPRRTESPVVHQARQMPGAPHGITDAYQVGDRMLVLSHGGVQQM